MLRPLLQRLFLFAVAVAFAAVGLRPAGSDAQTTATPSAGDQPAAADASDADVSDADLYTLPDGATEEDAAAQLTKVQRNAPETNSVEAIQANLNKVIGFADQILARDYSDAMVQNTAALKYSVFNALQQLGDADALDRRAAWVKSMQASDDETKANVGNGFAALEPVVALAFVPNADEAAWREAVQPSVEMVSQAAADGRELSPFELEIVMAVSEMLDGPAPKSVAGPAFESFAAAFAKSSDPRLQQAAEMFAATGRKLSLPGSPIVIEGQTLDGDAFDIQKDYAGKVVLVDFWATWCGFCIEAFPQMKKVYADRQADGFEIVGVNLDDTREVVFEFLDTNPLPWTNIQVLDGPDGKHANARRYAVSGIPFLVLVGKDGKVISTTVTPETLDAMVAEALAVE